MDKDTKRLTIDATEGYLQYLFNLTDNRCIDEKLEKKYQELLSSYPVLSNKPDEASKQLYQIYIQQYPMFKDTTTAFIDNPENEFTKKRYTATFALMRCIVEDLTDKMIDYGEWETEAKFEDIPDNPFLDVDFSKCTDYMALLKKRMELLETVNRHLEEIMPDNDKGKYMTTSALLSGILFDIALIIKYIG